MLITYLNVDYHSKLQFNNGNKYINHILKKRPEVLKFTEKYFNTHNIFEKDTLYNLTELH